MRKKTRRTTADRCRITFEVDEALYERLQALIAEHRARGSKFGMSPRSAGVSPKPGWRPFRIDRAVAESFFPP